MKIVANILITLAFMFWPILFAMSPMMLAAPGTENDKSQVGFVILLLSFPVAISLLLWIFGGSYFGISGLKLTIISTAVVVSGLTVFGYFGMYLNLTKGISNSGYSVAAGRVYYDGKVIEGADSESFSILEDDRYGSSIAYSAKDGSHLYHAGVIVQGAIPGNLKRIKINNETYWVNATQVILDDRVLQDANPQEFYGFENHDYSGWTYSTIGQRYTVYIHGKRLPGVDRDSFTPLSEFFAKDKNHIFKQDEIILPEANAEDFELLEYYDFGKDKNHIYYLAHLQPFAIKGIDVESFEILERGFLRDKNHVYVTHQYSSITRLEQADAASFEVTGYEDSTDSDARDKNHYYYGEKVVGNR